MVDIAPNRGYNEITVKGNTRQIPDTGQRIKQESGSESRTEAAQTGEVGRR